MTFSALKIDNFWLPTLSQLSVLYKNWYYFTDLDINNTENYFPHPKPNF